MNLALPAPPGQTHSPEEPGKPPEETIAPFPGPAMGSRRTRLALACLGFAVIGAVVTLAAIGFSPGPTLQSPPDTALEMRATVEQQRQIDTLSRQVSDLGQALDRLQRRLDEAAGRLDETGTAARSVREDTSRELSALLEREARASRQTRELAAIMVLSLSLSRLEQAVDMGGPFTVELDRLAAAGGPDVQSATRTLSARAATGIATQAQLARRFVSEVSPSPLAAVASPDGSPGSSGATGWLDRAINQIRSLVVIRRASELDGMGKITGEHAFQISDVPVVAARLAQTDGLSAAASAWLADAKAEQTAREAIKELHGYALDRLQRLTGQ